MLIWDRNMPVFNFGQKLDVLGENPEILNVNAHKNRLSPYFFKKY